MRTVLCVDDDLDDQLIICEAIREVDPSLNVVSLKNGLEALQYLKGFKNHETLPCLVTLDINMPLMDGKQALVQIKKDHALKHIPVVLFTTSSSLLDKKFCEAYNVPFITKPTHMHEIKTLVTNLLDHCKD